MSYATLYSLAEALCTDLLQWLIKNFNTTDDED